jgi:Zn-dependent peptidase ImmA (M78 family)/transcriptional regulator with XRE-family HTH domain
MLIWNPAPNVTCAGSEGGTVDAIELGRRLRDARQKAGVQQQAVADALSIPRTAVSMIESGKRAVSTLELTKLADLYRRSVSALLGSTQEDDDEDLVVALLRADARLERDDNTRRHIDRFKVLWQLGADLERALGRGAAGGPPAYDERAPRYGGEAVGQGERVAEQERRRLSIGNAPIGDLTDLIAKQGIWTASASLDPAISGLFLRHRSIGFAILVNEGHNRARNRFSYAHEYAHALLDRDSAVTVSSRENASNLVEMRANAFAAAFLMPAEGVSDLLQSLDKGQGSRTERTLFDVAGDRRMDAEIRPAAGSQRITYQDAAVLGHHFGVSYQAAVYRLKSLHYVSAPQADELLVNESFGRDYLKALSMLEDIDGRQPDRERELVSQIAYLAIEAYRREEISRGRLMEVGKILNLDGRKLVGFGDAAKTG